MGGHGERCNFVHSLSKRLEEKVGAIKKEEKVKKRECVEIEESKGWERRYILEKEKKTLSKWD